MNALAKNGYMGPEFEAMNEVGLQVCEDYLDKTVGEPSLSCKKTIANITSKERKMRAGYLKHN